MTKKRRPEGGGLKKTEKLLGGRKYTTPGTLTLVRGGGGKYLEGKSSKKLETGKSLSSVPQDQERQVPKTPVQISYVPPEHRPFVKKQTQNKAWLIPKPPIRRGETGGTICTHSHPQQKHTPLRSYGHRRWERLVRGGDRPGNPTTAPWPSLTKTKETMLKEKACP